MVEASTELRSLPTHKLLPLIHQLACQLGPISDPHSAKRGSPATDDGAPFQAALREV